MIVGHQNAYTDYMRMDGTQLLSLRESEADAEAEQATYRRDSRPQACHLSFHASSSRAWESYRNVMHNLPDKIQQVSAISMIQHMTFHCARASNTPNTSAGPTESATHELPSQPSSFIGASKEKWSEKNGSNMIEQKSKIWNIEII